MKRTKGQADKTPWGCLKRFVRKAAMIWSYVSMVPLCKHQFLRRRPRAATKNGISRSILRHLSNWEDRSCARDPAKTFTGEVSVSVSELLLRSFKTLPAINGG